VAGSPVVVAPYLLRPRPRVVLVGAVAGVMVPLLVLVEVWPDAAVTSTAVRAYAVALGLTHFIAVFSVYLLTDHRKHFASSLRGRAFYFGLPALSLATFAVWSQRPPVYLGLVLMGVRACDFYHVGRQSFGVLQLLRRSPTTAERRAAESAHFVCLAVAQWLVYLDGGRVSIRSPLGLLATLVLTVGVVGALSAGWGGAGLRAEPEAWGYLVVQTVGGVLAVLDTRLYLLVLALHYVEYHTLLAPRLFCGEVRLRVRPATFYALLLLAAVVVEWLRTRGAELATVAILDGLYIAHYLLDGELWRFAGTFYGERVLPLYVARPAAQPVSELRPLSALAVREASR
jgi:hypothetical protein